MSCFQVSDDTIKAIAFAAAPADFEVFAANVATLHAANVAAMSERYSDENSEPTPVVTKAEALRMPRVEAIALLKSMDCYEYQACDWNGYDQSEARKVVEAARRKTIRTLAGYDAAAWA